jgi:excisionase family DNA binding protein
VTTLINSSYVPTDDDAKLSKESSKVLAAHIGNTAHRLKFIEEDGSERAATIPATAYRLLVDILVQMSQGNAVSIVPIHAELTTQEAADLLKVSRPFLIKLLEAGEMPFHKIGKHRRIGFKDVVAYKERIDAERAAVLDELVAQAQELGMGYD